MLQRSVWMRPALQTREAVLLPALSRQRLADPYFSDRYTKIKNAEDPFRPIPEENIPQNLEVTALSTYVRPRGSMAGRGVLRAAGVYCGFCSRGRKPQYYAKSSAGLRQRYGRRL